MISFVACIHAVYACILKRAHAHIHKTNSQALYSYKSVRKKHLFQGCRHFLWSVASLATVRDGFHSSKHPIHTPF